MWRGKYITGCAQNTFTNLINCIALTSAEMPDPISSHSGFTQYSTIICIIKSKLNLNVFQAVDLHKQIS